MPGGAFARSRATAADVSEFEFHFLSNIEKPWLDKATQRLTAGMRPSQCDSVRGAFLFHVRSCGSGAFIGCAIRSGGPLWPRLGVVNRRSCFENSYFRDDHTCLLSASITISYRGKIYKETLIAIPTPGYLWLYM